MKTMIALLTLALSLTTFAQGGGDRVGSGQLAPTLLQIEYPAGPMMLKKVSRVIEIKGNGRVVETHTEYKPTGNKVTFNLLLILDQAAVQKLTRCSSQLYNLSPVVDANESCMDDVGTRYSSFYAQKTFAIRKCGQLQALPNQCAKDMVKVLDSLIFYSPKK